MKWRELSGAGDETRAIVIRTVQNSLIPILRIYKLKGFSLDILLPFSKPNKKLFNSIFIKFLNRNLSLKTKKI